MPKPNEDARKSSPGAWLYKNYELYHARALVLEIFGRTFSDVAAVRYYRTLQDKPYIPIKHITS